MSARKATRRPKVHNQPDVKALHFCESDRDLPIAGTPAPKPCPFCGKVDCFIAFNNGEHLSAYVQCDYCGVETGHVTEVKTALGNVDRSPYSLALEAARLWNEREAGAP